MTPDPSVDCRKPHEVMADEAYCRLRTRLVDDPAAFIAQCDGLVIDTDTLDELLFAPLDAAALPRATVIATAKRDGWLLRSTSRFWILQPEAFGCTEEPPAGVRDHRWGDPSGRGLEPDEVEMWQ